MASKVEEARTALFNAINPHTFLNDGQLDHYEGDHAVTVFIDSLISAAELQGMKKQQEQDTQYDKYEREAYEQAEKVALAKARSEGVAEERERIRKLAMPVDNFLHQMSLIIPLSAFNDPTPVLAPTKEGGK